MRLSVIIPVYNVENYVVRCLESLHRQTIQDAEFLIINDGSTDDSEKRIKEYLTKISDSRFKYYLKSNGGLSDARNFGMERSIGKYLFFVDSDDAIVNNKTIIEKLLNIIELNQLDVLDFNFEIVEKDKSKSAFSKNRSYNKIMTGTDFYFDLMNKRVEFNDINEHVPVWHFIYKREFIIKNAIKFPVGKLCEDTYWTPMVLLKAKKMMCIYEIGYKYSIRENSIMTNKKLTSKRMIDYLDILLSLKKEIFELDSSDKLKIPLVHYIFDSLINLTLYTENNIKNKDIKKILDGFDLNFKERVKKIVLLMPSKVRKFILNLIRGN